MIPKEIAIWNRPKATLKNPQSGANSLPRKILNYKKTQEDFLEEVKKLVDLDSV